MTHGSIVAMSFMSDCLPFISVIVTAVVLGTSLGPKVVVAAVCMVFGSIVRRQSTRTSVTVPSNKKGAPVPLEATVTTCTDSITPSVVTRTDCTPPQSSRLLSQTRVESTTLSTAPHHLISIVRADELPFAEPVLLPVEGEKFPKDALSLLVDGPVEAQENIEGGGVCSSVEPLLVDFVKLEKVEDFRRACREVKQSGEIPNSAEALV